VTGAAPQNADVPVANVEAALQAILASLERRAYLWLAVAIVPLIAPISLLLILVDWRLAVLLGCVWLAVTEFVSSRVAQATGRRAARRFDREFPEKSSVRPLALSILERLHSEACPNSLDAMRQALGLPSGVYLSGASCVPAVAPVATTSALPIAGSGVYVPLEIGDKNARPSPAASARLCVPIEPIAPAEKEEGASRRAPDR
jgi:hypothetical protein